MVNKNKYSFIYVILSLLVWIFSSCGDNDVQLPDKQLEGTLNGQSWSYKSANAYLYSSDGRYEVRFLSSTESVKDPCTLPAPSRAHIRAILKPAVGSFFVEAQAVNDNQAQVFFELSTSQTLTATSGFIEIYAIDGQVIVGYLQAVLDDENTVEGTFEIRTCN